MHSMCTFRLDGGLKVSNAVGTPFRGPKRSIAGVLTRQIVTAKIFSLAVLLGVSAVSTHAGSASGQFNVTVELQPATGPVAPSSAFCVKGPGPDTFGAIVTIVCATGVVVDVKAPRTAAPWVPIHGGAYRYTHLAGQELPGGRLMGGIDSYTGVGTVTTWRRVSLPDQDYLEMLVGW